MLPNINSLNINQNDVKKVILHMVSHPPTLVTIGPIKGLNKNIILQTY